MIHVEGIKWCGNIDTICYASMKGGLPNYPE